MSDATPPALGPLAREVKVTMSPGQIARRLLGPAFPFFGEIYRRIFVDMNKVTDWMAGHIPANGDVLDVGGGDGYVVNMLLAKRPDIRVTMTDVADQIGGLIASSHRSRVQLRPSWRFAEIYGSFDVLTVSDVVHHVPAQERPRFFADIVAVARRTDCRTIIIKDVEPGGLRAKLAEWADHFITGDRQVRLLAPNQIVLPGYRCVEVAMPDYPNYCLRFVLVST